MKKRKKIRKEYPFWFCPFLPVFSSSYNHLKDIDLPPKRRRCSNQSEAAYSSSISFDNLFIGGPKSAFHKVRFWLHRFALVWFFLFLFGCSVRFLINFCLISDNGAKSLVNFSDFYMFNCIFLWERYFLNSIILISENFFFKIRSFCYNYHEWFLIYANNCCNQLKNFYF